MVRITILVMYINCLSKYSVYLRWLSLICDVDHGLRLVRPLLNGQYNVSNSLQTIIYIFSILDLPRSDLGRDLREKCGAVLLFEAGDNEPIHTDRFTDDLEEVLERPNDQEAVIYTREEII